MLSEPPAVPPAEAFSHSAPLRWALATGVITIFLFAIAGDLRSPYLWGLAVGCSAIALYAIRTMSPELARERYHPPTSGEDGNMLVLVRFIALATIVFALLDSGRWHLSPPMPVALRVAGLAAFIGGLAIFVHAMSVNRFFSSVVRIQADRGHYVIDSGPYARVRHPGYVGMLLVSALMPLAFGSWWAFLPGSLMVAFTLRRVWCEDRFLQVHLPGYREYADRVRSRLLPGIWQQILTSDPPVHSSAARSRAEQYGVSRHVLRPDNGPRQRSVVVQSVDEQREMVCIVESRTVPARVEYSRHAIGCVKIDAGSASPGTVVCGLSSAS